MPGNLQGRYIKLDVISGKNIQASPFRMPAGIYVFIKFDSRRCWKSAVRVLSSDGAVAWGDILTISPDSSDKLSLEIRASFELGRMLGNGELVRKFETSWNELLDHGDEPFDLSFLLIDDICPSLTLKVAFVNACGYDDSALLDSIVECEIARRTDAGHAQFYKYMRSKPESGVFHLNGAVNYFWWVVARCPVGHPDRAAALTNLAYACLQGYIRNDLQDIDSTTSLFRDVLALRSQGHPDHPLSLHYLGLALSWRHYYQRAPADIHEFALLYHRLLPLCPEGTYLRSIVVGANIVDRVIHECNDLPDDASDQGIRLRRVVLELCPAGHQGRPRSLDRLASVFRARFVRLGNVDDVDEGIQLYREAVFLCPEGHPDHDFYLDGLAYLLRCRFEHQGDPHDLNEVIFLLEEALRLRPVGHNSRGRLLGNLAGALIIRFKRCDGDIDDINRAISLNRDVLVLHSPGDPNRGLTLNDLAAALHMRYDSLHASKDDLNESIDLHRESLRLSRQRGYPQRHANLYNLSAALCSRLEETWKNEDVEEAIDLCKESLAVFPPLHPDRCTSYAWLQEAYMCRYRVQHNPADLSLAMENFELASKQPTQGFPTRIQIAMGWVDEAEHYQHESALEAYRTCLDLFDNHVMTRSSIISRRNAATAFRGSQSLPVNAASCAVRCNDLRQAVAIQEQGRGQQWSLASRLRTPLDDLKSTNPDLAHKFSELSLRLSDIQGSTVSTDSAVADKAAIQYRRLTKQWEAVVVEIRTLQGFSGFLLPPSYQDLQAAARDGPVIILIGSQYSCDAIIVPTSGEPHHVPLPSLALADLEKLKDDFAKAIRHAAVMAPTETRTGLIALLRIVWDEIMLPIVNVLQCDLKLKRRSRIWLCPTAAFTSIPLHAAHPSRTMADGSGRELCLEDIYICSYTPTLSALIRARQAMKTRETPSFVAIGQSEPGAGQGKVLAAVDSELELVHKLVPPNVKFTNISGHEATQAGALEALRRNTWVHLACHGKQDREQPYNSRFAMRDKPLTLLDIMENNAPQAEFAFLSACHTAVGDEQTPDEAIHLAAGLQFSGFKSVIGTLWVVDDAVAKHVVEAFYGNMFKDSKEGVVDCTKAARALNHATYTVKKVPLEQRIVFIHIGV
ncbi:CHAT domain-containing protein [Suillus paluster]|uniref:CHAT domain-containing protein n=1 Tax=Suillus paluster TaxID=48578 RepID=UPI001B879EAD|nr:CHAT domain-containing protein [Suillus paluster]KAG1732254.1 CHAT domain-containing protein [Suillus paluster]